MAQRFNAAGSWPLFVVRFSLVFFLCVTTGMVIAFGWLATGFVIVSPLAVLVARLRVCAYELDESKLTILYPLWRERFQLKSLSGYELVAVEDLPRPLQRTAKGIYLFGRSARVTEGERVDLRLSGFTGLVRLWFTDGRQMLLGLDDPLSFAEALREFDVPRNAP